MAEFDPIRPSDTDSLRTREQPLKVVGGTLVIARLRTGSAARMHLAIPKCDPSKSAA
jgi:hypothetical protein